MALGRPFEGILLVSDMDGTLIKSDFSIPERNVAAVDRFIAEGGLFSLATGRMAESAGRYLHSLSTNAPCILMNGGAICDMNGRRDLWSVSIPESIAATVAKAIERFPDVGVEIYRSEEVYIVNRSVWTDRHIVNEGFHFHAASLREMPGDGWQKFLFAGEQARLQEVEAFMDREKPEGVYFVYSSNCYFEGLPAGVSKGSALKRLARMLGISMSRTVAIGDYYNDEELVKTAGFGAAVRGAPQALLDAVQFVAGSCEDGAVADLIEYLETDHSRV